MDIKTQIIEIIKSTVLDSNGEKLFREPLIGFSSSKDPLYYQIKKIVGDHHLFPSEILSDAKTIISFFVPFDKRIVEANKKTEKISYEWAYTYIKANELINRISDILIEELNKKGINAATVRATHTYDPEKLVASWSHRSVAYIAGLGNFGVNRLLITEVGCAGRYGSVIISEEIKATEQPNVERCIHKQGGKCLECIKNCPTHALGINKLDKHKCNDHLLKVDAMFPQLDTCDVCGKCSVGPCAVL